MTRTRASQFALTCALIAACSTGGPSGDYGQIRQAAGGAFITPYHCGDMFPDGPGDICTTLDMDSGAQATAATFAIVSVNPSNAQTAAGVVKQTGQTFRPNRSGQNPGTIGLILRLVSDTNLVTTEHDLLISMVDLGFAPTMAGATTTIPTYQDAQRCDAPPSTIATARYNSQLLTFGVDTEVRISFTTQASVIMVNDHQYGVIFQMEEPGINNVGIAANDQSRDFYPRGNAVTRQQRLLRVNTNGGGCYSNTPFIVDKNRDLNFYLSLGDGCDADGFYACGRGACTRTIPQCDSYGIFNQCHPGYCTTDADCVLDSVHPDRGPLAGSTCLNPSHLDNAGICTTVAESCNGVDDDCNGQTDDNLPDTSCGLGACHTTIYSCENFVNNTDYYTNVNTNVPATGFLNGRAPDCFAAEPQPSAEQCDGIDNDCEGHTDDGLPQTADCGQGPCRRNVYSCILSGPDRGTAAMCTPDFTQSSNEQCNGIDDDCDGTVDDIGGTQPFGPFDTTHRLWQSFYPPGATVGIAGYYPPSFTQPVPPNAATNQGECHYGRNLCSAAVGSGVAAWSPDVANPWVTPVAEYYPATSIYVCDGLDNDCDGYTDNVAGTPTRMARSYWPNSNSTMYSQAVRNTGICQDGVETCAAVTGTVCTTDAQCSAPQRCNTTISRCDNTASPDTNAAADKLAWNVTTAPTLATTETCNGLDDDCNATTDDRSVLGQQLCGQGICQTIVDNCSFVTNMGWTTLGGSCTSGSYVNRGNINLSTTEICNGLDDNCDGQTDYDNGNARPLAVSCHPLCDAFNAAHPGSGTVCQYPSGNAQGICRYGLQYCVTGTFQACGAFMAQTELPPTDELCDNLDNDCDGRSDNIANTNTSIKGQCSPACAGWGSLCRPNVGQCRGGTATCTSGALVTAECASTEVGPSTDRCNGFDDDCDSYSDNIPGTSTKIATSTLWNCGAFTGCVSGSSTILAVGQCHAGSSSCSGVAGYTTVSTAPVGPSTEICNQLDDDCDVAVDNKPGQGAYTLQQTCSTQCANWLTNNPGDNACIAGTGQCRNGTQTCSSSGWGGCPTSGGNQEIGPSVESCNGFDDNCDGTFDNQPGAVTKLVSGNACQNQCDLWTVGNGKASNCVPNAGQCRKGTGTCNAVANSGIASWTGCSVAPAVGGEIAPSTELCNGVDDDCDVYTDTVPGSPGTRLSTGSSWSCTGFGTACKNFGPTNNGTQTTSASVGQCRVGTQTCSSGSYSLNSGSPVGPSSDTCNGYDDDCDASTDNVMNSLAKLTTAVGFSCNGQPGCNTAVTTGACRPGTNTCSGGPGVASYSTVTLVPYNASVETCNGVDDDCETGTDNYPGSSTKLQTAAGWSCSSIIGCHAYSTANNGTQTTAFAYGACRVGTSSCQGGSYSLSLNAPYNASTDSCNGIDDDCDSYTDNIGGQVNTTLKTSTFWSCSGFPGCVNGNATTLTFGACKAGTNTCAGVGGFTTVNNSAVGPSAETCDAVDNDCDGQADNYGGNGTTTKLQTSTFGALCWNGTYSCYGGANLCHSGTASCTGLGGYNGAVTGGAAVAPSTEVCNGFDDECDGATDNATPGNATKLATAITWSCTGFPGCAATTGVRGQCRAGTNSCTGAVGYTTALSAAVGPSYERCNGLDDDCTTVNDDGVEVMNGSTNLCAVQNTTPGSAGYQVNANATVVNSVNQPCVSGVCGVGAKRYDVVAAPTQVGWFGGCVSGYFDSNSSYADGCECTDDQFALTNTAPAGCVAANGDCAQKSTVTCEFGQDLCSVPGAAGCSGGYMGGGATAVANVNASATAKGQIPNQVFRDYYYVKLGVPNFPASGYRGVNPPSESIALNLTTAQTPTSTNSQVFLMRVFPYGSFTDTFSVGRSIQSPMGGTTTSTYNPGGTNNGCSNIMTQVLGNGTTQGLGVFSWQAGSIATAATYDLTHYTWNESLCPADGSAGNPSWCSQNVTWPNWLVVEVRRTSWAGSTLAPWEWVPGSSGHGSGNGFANTTSQSVGPGCGNGVMADSANCTSGLISAGGAPTMPSNYYTLSMSYSTGATP